MYGARHRPLLLDFRTETKMGKAGQYLDVNYEARVFQSTPCLALYVNHIIKFLHGYFRKST